MANSRVLVVLLGAFMVLTKADTILRLKRGKYVDQVSRVRKSNWLCILKSDLIVLLDYNFIECDLYHCIQLLFKSKKYLFGLFFPGTPAFTFAIISFSRSVKGL